MKRARWPFFGRVTSAVLLIVALALLVGGCSPSVVAPTSTSVSTATTRAPRTVQSSRPPTTRPFRPPTSSVPSTSPLPAETTTTAGELPKGDANSVAEELGPSVVGVSAVLFRSLSETVESVGTGVVYSAAGLIITANHVITGGSGDPAKHLIVALPSGSVLAATLVGRDATTDVAVLRVRADGLHAAVLLTDLSALSPGDFVVAIGNAKVLAHPVTSGYVTAFLRNAELQGLPGVHEVIESSTPLAHGNSGGPLADAEGRVVGINVAELLGGQGGVTLPSDLVIEVVERLTSAG